MIPAGILRRQRHDEVAAFRTPFIFKVSDGNLQGFAHQFWLTFTTNSAMTEGGAGRGWAEEESFPLRFEAYSVIKAGVRSAAYLIS